MKHKALLNCTLNIPKNVFDNLKMGRTRVVHELTHLIDSKGNIRSRESEILEATHHAAIGRGIRQGIAIQTR